MNAKIVAIAAVTIAVCCISVPIIMTAMNHEEQNNDPPAPDDPKTIDKVLLVYFSATGVTDTMANKMADYIGADTYRIIPEQEYTAEDLNRSDPSCRCNQESSSTSVRPAIASETIDLSKYDTILLGYPIWYHKAPRIIMTFLDAYDLSDKIIVTFCTSWGTGIATSHMELTPFEPKATWIMGTNFTSSASDSELTQWLSSVGFKVSQ